MSSIARIRVSSPRYCIIFCLPFSAWKLNMASVKFNDIVAQIPLSQLKNKYFILSKSQSLPHWRHMRWQSQWRTTKMVSFKPGSSNFITKWSHRWVEVLNFQNGFQCQRNFEDGGDCKMGRVKLHRTDLWSDLGSQIPCGRLWGISGGSR